SSIAAGKRILVAFLDGAGEAALVDGFPTLGKIGEEFVMAAADDVAVQAIAGKPAAARNQISHVAIEHGDGGGTVFDKQAKLLLTGAQSLFGLLALRNDGGERDAHDGDDAQEGLQ